MKARQPATRHLLRIAAIQTMPNKSHAAYVSQSVIKWRLTEVITVMVMLPTQQACSCYNGSWLKTYHERLATCHNSSCHCMLQVGCCELLKPLIHIRPTCLHSLTICVFCIANALATCWQNIVDASFRNEHISLSQYR